MADDRDEEAVLLARARARDPDAFGRLVSRYEEPLLAVLTPIAGDREKARDLAQEAALRAYEHLDRYVEEHKFSTWYFRIGVNLAISSRRRTRLEERTFQDRARKSGAGYDDGPSAFELAARDEETAAVTKALDRLPARYARVVRLRFLDGLSCQEIARRLKATPNVVSLILFRAKQRLREELSPE
ncbi:MAG TPA: sigma-70 family RNA polymerase sigma factor [Planctomycetota bacterium]|nr:sigma-70 family RNA polymerase sigma factor [Planctomycetota bacterium]